MDCYICLANLIVRIQRTNFEENPTLIRCIDLRSLLSFVFFYLFIFLFLHPDRRNLLRGLKNVFLYNFLDSPLPWKTHKENKCLN